MLAVFVEIVRYFSGFFGKLTAIPSTGARGEQAAAKYLKRRGYLVFGRNLRNRLGEIDLLAEAPDRNTIVVVEVKARTGNSQAFLPETRVAEYKKRKLTALGALVARRYNLINRPFRFDIVGVDCPIGSKPVVRHHVGAFESHV